MFYLSPSFKTLATLRRFEGFSKKQIAEFLHVSTKTIARHESRGGRDNFPLLIAYSVALSELIDERDRQLIFKNSAISEDDTKPLRELMQKGGFYGPGKV